MDFWQILGIAATGELKPIKKAYAAKLKQCKPDKDPQGYQQLREAFERAKDFVKYYQSLEPQEQAKALEQTDSEQDKIEASSSAGHSATLQKQLQEQQHKQQQKQQLWESYQEKAIEVCNYIFAASQSKICKQRFEEVLERDDFQSIEARHILSNILMQTVMHWPLKEVFPADTVQFMAHKFKWYEEYTNQQITQILNIIKERCEAHQLYNQLIADGFSIRSTQDDAMIKAVGLLNTPFNHRQSRWANFRAGPVRKHVYQLIHTLLNNFDYRFYPLLKKANLRWWLDQEQQFNFTIWPAFIAFTLALATLSSLPGLFQTIWQNTPETAQLLVYLITIPAVVVLSYLVLWLYFHLRKRFITWYFIRWRPWLAENNRYRWFVFCYMSLFTSAGYLSTSMLLSEMLMYLAVPFLLLAEGIRRTFRAVLMSLVAWFISMAPDFEQLIVTPAQTLCMGLVCLLLIDYLANQLPPKRAQKIYNSASTMRVVYTVGISIICVIEFYSRLLIGGY